MYMAFLMLLEIMIEDVPGIKIFEKEKGLQTLRAALYNIKSNKN